MARIISSRKKYVPVKDLVVYPSKTETIEVIPDDGFNGAHRYRARMCAGFVNGKTKYVDATDTIQFVHKHEDGTITPGWQSEQLALILLDRVKKLNGIVTFPELNKGECVEMELICELKVKTRNANRSNI